MDEELFQKAQAYASRRSATVSAELGSGIHGSVFIIVDNEKPRRSAVKCHRERGPFERERDIYRCFADHGVTSILGFHVPQFLGSDEELMAIEMTIVSPPYLLDFAGAYLYEPPKFSEDVLADWEEGKREQFGSRWEDAQQVIAALRLYDVYLFDISPSNLMFRERPG